MTIENLKNALEVPENPIERGNSVDWSFVTPKLGLQLPFDYMSFINTYGSGEIGEWLLVFNPFSQDKNISFFDNLLSMLSSISTIKNDYPEFCPYPLLFEPGGLLPWGISFDGDIYCWLTEGLSSTWKVVVIGRQSEHEIFDFSFSDFLTLAIQGELRANTIPLEWKNNTVIFKPFQ